MRRILYAPAILTLACAACATTHAQTPTETNSNVPAGGLSALPTWDDGLCEMSYYRTVDNIYGKPRTYTRVQLVNRQWMDAVTGVKADPDSPQAVPVFKLNIAEEIPTENYNYRYLTTVFLKRPDLSPFKLVTSSQEWCGTTFKQARWDGNGISIKSFSYFGGEGDKAWSFGASDAVPYEALLLIARDVAAGGEPRTVEVMRSLRSAHEVTPQFDKVTLLPRDTQRVALAAGEFKARRVDVEWDGPAAGFLVEAEPPYRLLRFRLGPMRADLQHVERRPYWDRSSHSSFYKQGEAP